jgi:hypothetical protein
MSMCLQNNQWKLFTALAHRVPVDTEGGILKHHVGNLAIAFDEVQCCLLSSVRQVRDARLNRTIVLKGEWLQPAIATV